ncbi:MAG: carboxypeptidase-like regulatory domain-containing protein [Candidatus Omnitrophota bacterium]|jgi:hypothetical protein
MGDPANPKGPGTGLHAANLLVAMLAGLISIVGGVYTLKNNFFPTQTYGSLQGIVRDERLARPLLLSSVEISLPDGTLVNTAITDREGKFNIATLKTGNYQVKFTSPLHQVETKTVKVEKGLAATINVDLAPLSEPVQALPAVSSAEGVASRYPDALAQTASVSSPSTAQGYGGPAGMAQNAAGSYPSSSPQGMRGPQYPAGSGDSMTGSTPWTGHRRRHVSPSGVPDAAYPDQEASEGYGAQAPSSGSLNNVLGQAGVQLVQDFLSKKSDKQGSS